MRVWIRRGLWTVLCLALLAAALVFVGLQLGERRAARQIQVAVQPVPIPTDAAALERGRYLFMSRGCAECHGANGAGRTFADDAKAGLKIAGANLTRGGAGSVTTAYQPVDWVRAIRHGLDPKGRPLQIMPSEDYNRFTDADLGAVIAYVLSLPPAAGGPAVARLPLPARVLYGFGQIPNAVDRIDHTLPPQQPVAEGVNVAHGQYVANLCLGCHGEKLEGGKIPGGPPDWPAAARLVPGDGNVMATRYAEADAFLKMLQTGKSPDGRALAVMPFDSLKHMSEVDARALHLYLKSLTAPR
ncbi:MAG TPA: cytochrome c [Burkholderiaceae bacterium]|nr:cytochrome c [Burkholderiaceae bacterium]